MNRLSSFSPRTPMERRPAPISASEAVVRPIRTMSTDDSGVAVVPLSGGAKSSQQLNVEAKDRDGNRAVAPVTLQVNQGADQVLLQPDRALYKPGDRIKVQIFSLRQRGSGIRRRPQGPPDRRYA